MKLLINYRRIFLALILLCISIPFCSVFAGAKYYPDNTENIYVHKINDENMISLTFDDGPHPDKTPEILRVLKKHNIRATFFIIGQNASLHPEIVQMIAADGHEIANHTNDHKSLYKQTDSMILDSVRSCSDTLFEIVGSKPKLFRPPEGYMNDNIARLIRDEGYDVILWKIDTYDWKGRSDKEICNTVINNIKSGDIVLMHDFIWRKSNTADALDMMIPRLKEQGFSFVTVSELIAK